MAGTAITVAAGMREGLGSRWLGQGCLCCGLTGLLRAIQEWVRRDWGCGKHVGTATRRRGAGWTLVTGGAYRVGRYLQMVHGPSDASRLLFSSR